MNHRRGFIKSCFVGIGASVLWVKGALGKSKPKQEKSQGSSCFRYRLLYREDWENFERFVERVMEYTSDIKTYDVTYTKMPPFKTGYVATLRRPEIKFFPDIAIVWWWAGFERFPEDIEKWKKKK